MPFTRELVRSERKPYRRKFEFSWLVPFSVLITSTLHHSVLWNKSSMRLEWGFCKKKVKEFWRWYLSAPEESETELLFGLVWFYNISTIVVHLMPNPLYTYIHHHHHHVAPSARISLTLFRHPPLLPSGLQSYVPYQHRASVSRFELVFLPLFVHMKGPLMSSSLLLQQFPTCLVRLSLIVFVMAGWWPYSCCFVGCLFNIARSILA